MGRAATPLTLWLRSPTREPFLMTCAPGDTHTRHLAIGAQARRYRVYIRYRTILGHYLDAKESVAVIEITKADHPHPTRGRKRCKQ